LVVDDDQDARRALVRMLAALGHETEEASDGLECMAKLALEVDLIVLDATMPNMDGFQVTQRVRHDPAHKDLPIVMVTGLDSFEDRLRAVEAGVNDFLTKPFDFTELRLRVAWLLRMKEATDALQRQRADLERTVERRTEELRRALDESVRAQRDAYSAQLDTIRRLVLAAEYKDRDTAAHIERIGAFSAVIGRTLGMGPAQVEVIRYASQMHDVGKMGIPDAILLKPGPLTDAEWVIMKSHTTLGARILDGSPSELLTVGHAIALTHHERWDGSGYPVGIAGEDIPLEGRICAVADVFDALSTNRHYRDAVPLPTVYEMMDAGRGKHLDPRVLDAFFTVREEIEAIQRAWSDRAIEAKGS
jgi:putative two-component system response regulator